MNGGKYYLALKRLIDIITSALGLLFLSPVLAGLAAVIVLYSPGPVFYFSSRVGRRGVPFKMWKFRSMIPNADRAGSSVTTNDDPRITPFGRVLRRSKLDELPSLFNVLRGDMSLVGPRPETPKW